MRRINAELWKKHWCEFKHLVGSREISIETTAFIAREICGAQDSKHQEYFIKMLHDATANTQQIEAMLMQLTEFASVEADATDMFVVEVTDEQYTHFLQQLGHLVCAEEHVSDHLKSVVELLKTDPSEDLKKKYAVDVNKLIEILDSQRLLRQNVVNRFLSWQSAKEGVRA